MFIGTISRTDYDVGLVPENLTLIIQAFGVPSLFHVDIIFLIPKTIASLPCSTIMKIIVIAHDFANYLNHE